MSDMIQEIRSGNKDAVKAVYQEYAKDVYNFAKSITGDHDSALAATKKTFLTLFKNIQNGDEPQNLRTAALKIAYDEAYQMAVPKDEPAPAEEPAAQVEEPQAPAEEPSYAEPMFQQRTRPVPPVDDYEEEYEDTYEEEEDDFVAPNRPQDAEREDVYIPQGGYDTLKIEPVDVDEEAAEMRGRRRRPADEFDEDGAPRRRRRAQEDPRQQRRRAQEVEEYDDDIDDAYDDDYYDDDDYVEEKKPRNKGLFIFCIILNVILILILLWFLGGLLVNLGVLPDIDLGYSWFNAHIYPLF